MDTDADSEAKTEVHDPLMLRARVRVGQVLRDKWRLDVLLGVGGMAAVYAATHRNGSRAAVKVLHSELTINPQVRTRFLREGYVANKVGHDGAVKVIDDDTAEDGSLFLVTELLDGETLEDRRVRLGGKLSEDDVLAVTDQILDVLIAAHAQGVVHRDLKPENVFTTRDGRVKILDFGIARLREATATTATKSGATMGTPYYMAPEQARGLWDEVDGRSDLWAVGATMYHALTGQFVHQGRTANEVLLAAMANAAPRIASVSPGISPSVAHVVDRALAFERDKRWPDAARMQEAVRRAYHDRNGAPIATAPRLTLPPSVPNRTLPGYEGATVRLPTTGQPVSNSQGGASVVATQPGFSRGAVVGLVLGGAVTIGAILAVVLVLALRRGDAPVAPSATQATTPPPATASAIPAPSASALPVLSPTDLPSTSATVPPPQPPSQWRPSPSPAKPTPPKPNCSQPYTIDAAGHRVLRPECM